MYYVCHDTHIHTSQFTNLKCVLWPEITYKHMWHHLHKYFRHDWQTSDFLTPIHHLSTTCPPIFLPPTASFTRPNDGWSGLHKAMLPLISNFCALHYNLQPETLYLAWNQITGFVTSVDWWKHVFMVSGARTGRTLVLPGVGVGDANVCSEGTSLNWLSSITFLCLSPMAYIHCVYSRKVWIITPVCTASPPIQCLSMLCHRHVVIVMSGLVKPCSCRSVQLSVGAFFLCAAPQRMNCLFSFLSGYVKIYLQIFFIKISSVKIVIITFFVSGFNVIINMSFSLFNSRNYKTIIWSVKSQLLVWHHKQLLLFFNILYIVLKLF